MLNSVRTVNEVFKERGVSIPLENHTSVTEKSVMKKFGHSEEALP